MSPPHPFRRTDALRVGRVSLPGARYFLTLCGVRPTSSLTQAGAAEAIHASTNAVLKDNVGRLLCSTIMPDHIHLLMELGNGLTIGQIVGKLKALSRAALASCETAWQRDFIEHRLRPDAPANAYARYIFMNPYRVSLLNRRAVWPWWRLGANVAFDFMALLEEGTYPPAEWLAEDPLAGIPRPEFIGGD